ncbi:uncharacterized protein FIBRA_05076 [Fibroporia radiculosa]|uniref:Cyclase n=1 Tax=Fibroporia radiculosa TaxID=599839 RepID=J4IAI3_9APHY|nr:uncharacterized protein FIBRA_05076 [Fibroporia radiculosa]CCM02961.1 predicted protein [Fibroporia radiculosa]
MNVQSLSLGSHTGTHIDAPSHFVASGKCVDEVPLRQFIGPALVIDVSGKANREKITWADLAPFEEEMRHRAAQDDGLILLLYTGWAKHWGTATYFDHPFIVHDAAVKMVEAGIRTIGVDTLSPDETFLDPEMHSSFDAHHVLLGAGCVIAENLTSVERLLGGEWVVNLVPLKIGGCDGSPVRAFAYRRM